MKFIAATTITVLALIGFGTIASAAWAEEPIPGPDGVCLQPGTNPPRQVPCTSPEATTPYVTSPTTTPTTVDQQAPVTTYPVGEAGLCRQPGSDPPRLVDCASTDATTPYTPTPTAVAPVVASAATTLTTEPEAITTPAPIVQQRQAPHRLPTTGSSNTILLVGIATLLCGAALLTAARRSAS